MEIVEVVIRLPKEDYEYVKEVVQKGEYALSKFYYTIANGTVLPKGHGRLIDTNILENIFINSSDWKGNINENLKHIAKVPTIIEADKTESEGKE